jgi:hypothetical protein
MSVILKKENSIEFLASENVLIIDCLWSWSFTSGIHRADKDFSLHFIFASRLHSAD